jgi:hypothetical protein
MAKTAMPIINAVIASKRNFRIGIFLTVWHGHTANLSARRRRSIQGAFIPREARSAINQAARIRPETFQRIGDLAKFVLDIDQPTSCDSRI